MANEVVTQFGPGCYITMAGYIATVAQVRQANGRGWWLQGVVEVPDKNPGVLYLHRWNLAGKSFLQDDGTCDLLRAFDSEID